MSIVLLMTASSSKTTASFILGCAGNFLCLRSETFLIVTGLYLFVLGNGYDLFVYCFHLELRGGSDFADRSSGKPASLNTDVPGSDFEELPCGDSL